MTTVPFTPSHVVAILPLVTGRRANLFDPAALTTGAMVPDLPYFVPPYVGARWTHAWSGPVTVDLVLGLVLLAVWRAARPGLVDLAPDWLRSRLRALPPVGGWGRAAWSVALGAVTHVVWDSFSHPHRWGTEHVSWLSHLHGPLAGYKWVQYGSGGVGLLVLGVWFVCWVSRTRARALPEGPHRARRRHRAWAGAVVVLAVVVAASWLRASAVSGRRLDERVAVDVVTAVLSACLAGLLAVAVHGVLRGGWRRIRDSNS